VFSEVCAAAVEPRGANPPPSVTPIDVRTAPHIQERRVGPWQQAQQQSMSFPLLAWIAR
jgi:hypothetical protein